MAYNTKQKQAIIEYLTSHCECHTTASEVFEYLKSEKTEIGLSTVYRQLEKMANEGILHKYFISDNTVACYQMKEKCGECLDNHYHLKCVRCGKLIHMECEEMHGVAEHILREHGFALDREKTVLYGICPDCRKIML